MSAHQHGPSAEVIDLADIFRSIRNGWGMVAGFTIGGLALGAAVLLLAPKSFVSDASVVLKTGNAAGQGSSLVAAIGSLAEVGGGGGGGGNPLSGLKSGVETEVEILKSRVLAEEVVDSLGLQAVIATPRGLPAMTVFDSLHLPGSFKRQTYTFEEVAGTSPRQYRYANKTDTGRATVGVPRKIGIGTIVLAATAPSQFKTRLLDRGDAATRVADRLSIEKPKSEVAHIEYTGDDSLTAARVPNLLLDLYFTRRKGIDRGVNQKRAEFLAAKVDSVRTQLGEAERALREQRERTGTLDPLMSGRVELENENRLRQQLGELQMQEGALQQLVTQIRAGTATPRQLASYPQYLGSGPINGIVSNLISVETERLALLATVTEEDERVKSLTLRARNLEEQLMPLAQTTLGALSAQRTSIQQRLAGIEQSLVGAPRAVEAYGRLEREIIDKGRIYAGLSTQLVDARLAAITEGGDVRTLDPAIVPKKPAFPKPSVTLAGGLAGGLFLGLFAAVLIGMIGGSMHDAEDVERRTGLSAVRLHTGAPLLVGGLTSRAVLVAPINSRAQAKPVAERLVETALSRGLSATLLDLSTSEIAPSGARLVTAGAGDPSTGSAPAQYFDANGSIRRLEETHDLVVVQLPDLASHAAAAVVGSTRPVLLVAPERRIERSNLQSAVDLLRRVGAPCAGVVLHGDDRRALRV